MLLSSTSFQLLLSFLVVSTLGCTHNKATTATPSGELVPKAGGKPSSAPLIDVRKAQGSEGDSRTFIEEPDQFVEIDDRKESGQETAAVPNVRSASCSTSPLLSSVPGYINPLQIVVTRVTESCENESGEQGYFAESSWMAMGFPCTSGNGNLVIRGKSYRPKMIVYEVSNDCPMQPQSTVDLKISIANLTDPFLSGQKLLALTPFSLQYWEAVDFPDAGVGTKIQMRSPSFLKQGWKEYNQSQPIKFRLYGQENAWVKGKKLFFREATVKREMARTFKIEVQSVKALSEDERQKIKARCELLRPKRPCGTYLTN